MPCVRLHLRNRFGVERMPSHIAVAGSAGTGFVPLLDVPAPGSPYSVSGILIGLGVARGDSYHHFKVTLDGSQLAEDIMCGAARGDEQNNGLAMGLPFASSLGVEISSENDSP